MKYIDKLQEEVKDWDRNLLVDDEVQWVLLIGPFIVSEQKPDCYNLKLSFIFSTDLTLNECSYKLIYKLIERYYFPEKYGDTVRQFQTSIGHYFTKKVD